MGKTLLQFHLERLKKTGFPIYVASTTEASDQQIEDLCAELGFECFRGSEENVLSRYLDVIRKKNIDIVIRVTSDCPLIDRN